MKEFSAEKVKNDLVEWMRNWISANGPDCNIVCGISGGKDSTVVATLAVEALGKDRVIGVLMPNGEQSDIDEARFVCEYLGIRSIEIDISDAVNSVLNGIQYGIYDGVRQGYDTLEISEQTKTNLPARIRMSTLFAVAQSCNGRVSCNCNLSEDYIGYSTFGGDDFGSFGPLRNLTTDEVVAIGDTLGLPYHLVHKTPSDGLCGKTDEDNFGFSYAVLNKYIRTGVCEDEKIKAKIDEMHNRNLFKIRPMHCFKL